jgi:hypothetical protein
VQEFARDLWRLAREVRHGEAGAWLTTAASVLIVLTASVAVLRRLWRWLGKALDWARGKQEAKEEFPEGA